MVQVIFDPASVGLLSSSIRLQPQTGEGFYVGSVYQRGRGLGQYGGRHMSGDGMGSVFKHLWRYIKPIAASAGKALGSEGLATSSRILKNIMQGDDLKETLLTEGQEGVKNLLDKASSKLARKQRGTGLYKRKRVARRRRIIPRIPTHQKTKVILQPEELIGQPVALLKNIKNKRKGKRSDTLGLY